MTFGPGGAPNAPHPPTLPGPRTSTPINLCLLQVTRASKVWGEVPLPEDLETDKHVKASQALLDDDEDFAADEASGGELHDARPPRVPAAALNSVVLYLHWEISQKRYVMKYSECYPHYSSCLRI